MNIKLSNAGFSVEVTTNGLDALEKAQSEKFDLIILDIMMPKMDGFSVLEKLREAQDNTPVIITSNLSQPEDENRAKELGAQEYFVKSILDESSGSISFTSEENVGTSFTVTLPLTGMKKKVGTKGLS